MGRKTATDSPEVRVRIDKWLWAARFYKTRSLASEAVQGGKVHLNDARVKPARTLSVGDQLAINKGGFECRVQVRGLSERRGPARQAQLLYEEDPESIRARQLLAEERKFEAARSPVTHGRPDKKLRRQWQKIHQR